MYYCFVPCVLGAESYIMEAFPLEKYRIKILTAERLKGSIRSYLKEKGYEFVIRLSSWGESLWILSSIKNELNWTAFHDLSNMIERNNQKGGRLKDLMFTNSPH
jgi:hypothetical protein